MIRGYCNTICRRDGDITSAMEYRLSTKIGLVVLKGLFTTTLPMVGPIFFLKYAISVYPIAKTKLLYSKRNDKTIPLDGVFVLISRKK